MSPVGRRSGDRVVGSTRKVLARATRGLRRGLVRHRGPLITLIALALLLLLVVWLGPSLLTRRPRVGGVDRHTAINGARTGLVALVAALGAVGGLLYTARTYRLSHRGQIAERFAAALEQLGHGSSSVRIGALYALNRIAEDNPAEYDGIVIDVLSAYVRDRAPWHPDASSATPQDQDESNAASVASPPSPDVKVALALLLPLAKRAQRKNVDLSNTNLAGTNLQEAHLLDSDLSRTNIRGALLNKAVLAGADLTGVTLDSDTSFYRTNLRGASGLEHVDATRFTDAEVPPRRAQAPASPSDPQAASEEEEEEGGTLLATAPTTAEHAPTLN